MISRRSSNRPGARQPGGFYGWHVTGFAAVLLMATAPGQTAGVSAFIDPMIADLGVDRTTLSTAYLIGTLTGALVVPRIGGLIDKWGVRRCTLVIGAAFGAVLLAMGAIGGFVGLLFGFMGIRSLGQGALGLAATTAAARWFERKRGRALGIVAAAGSAGISLAPVLSEWIIAQQGWRTAWFVLGIIVLVLVLPVAAFGLRDDPSDLGQMPDGTPVTADTTHGPRWGLTRRQAFSEPYFWVLISGLAVSGMLGTAVAFHQINLLGAKGLTSAEAAANFIPQTVAGLVATLVVGNMIDRLSIRWVVLASMSLHVAALAWLTVVTPGWSAIAFGLAIGAAGSSIRIAEAAAIPAYFGVLHLGSIRGFVASISVGSTALGPLLFSVGKEATGSFDDVILLSIVLPVAVAVASLIFRIPRRPVLDEPIPAH